MTNVYEVKFEYKKTDNQEPYIEKGHTQKTEVYIKISYICEFPVK